MRLPHRLLVFALLFGCDDTKEGGISSGGEAVDAGSDGDGGGSGSGSGDSGSGSGSGSGDDGGSGSGDSGSGSGSGDDSGSGSDGAPCETAVVGTVPELGATDWFYLSPLEIELSVYDPTTQITLSQGGTPVPGSQQLDDDNDRLIRFIPDGPLEPSTSYAVNVAVCSGAADVSVGFSTSELGTPLACSLEGLSFRTDLTGARFIKPDPGVASLLVGLLTHDYLLGVVSESAGELELHAAVTEEGSHAQDYCEPSIDLALAPARWSDPTFEVGPQDTVLGFGGLELQVSDLYIRGTFAPDCSYTAGGRWEGELDARTLAPLLEDTLGTDDPDDVCSYTAALGIDCAPCSTDGAVYCIELEIDQLSGPATGSSLSCVDEVDCHPLCARSTCDTPEVGECD